ncbi:MAG: ABC-type spermidine/putrescine transport system, permease component [Acidimicrobiales bacterium]|nr:ABC-type spermidine/putrescine transport system, permease component [Acidimicrobiales bacterium]
MAGKGTGPLRKGRFAPYGLLSPGLLWLVLFFLVPMWTLLKIAVSTKPNPYLPEYDLTWRWANFSDAVSRFQPELVRSFGYAAMATVLCIGIGYPLAYYLAFRAGRWRTLLLGLIMVPFFTSFLIRTIAWQTILGSDGPALWTIRTLHLSGAADVIGLTTHGGFLNTPQAVIGGLTYNFVPFMILPIYVSLEKIDVNLMDAARDLYSKPSMAFRKIVLPLSLPGVFAGTLLTFIPAAGDYINAELLGNVRTGMIGSQVAKLFLRESNYPAAAALSFIFMAIITAGVLIYARLLGTQELTA